MGRKLQYGKQRGGDSVVETSEEPKEELQDSFGAEEPAEREPEEVPSGFVLKKPAEVAGVRYEIGSKVSLTASQEEYLRTAGAID